MGMVILAKTILLIAAWLFAGAVGAACQESLAGKQLKDRAWFAWVFWFSFIFILVGGFL